MRALGGRTAKVSQGTIGNNVRRTKYRNRELLPTSLESPTITTRWHHSTLTWPSCCALAMAECRSSVLTVLWGDDHHNGRCASPYRAHISCSRCMVFRIYTMTIYTVILLNTYRIYVCITRGGWPTLPWCSRTPHDHCIPYLAIVHGNNSPLESLGFSATWEIYSANREGTVGDVRIYVRWRWYTALEVPKRLASPSTIGSSSTVSVQGYRST